MSSRVINYPDLPINAQSERIKQAISEHQVLVLAGETGSGKTTQLPKFCLELGLSEQGLIGHTQPRRLAARNVASRIASELQSTLGELVGYQVRFNEQCSEATEIKLMTDGILLAETQTDPLLKKYSVLIIDEAHERSLNIDFLLGYIKRILPKRPDLKVIITSATIDLERFSNHFDQAPIIEVSGRTYPVELWYRPLPEEKPESDVAVLAAIDELAQWERSQGKTLGDILIFLSGEREIRELTEFLQKSAIKHTEILPLYARLGVKDQQKIFHPSGNGRRIILSTNVAETSLTVPGIRYVIDLGMARISRYSYRSKLQRLPIEPISQASANQRKGRCGRVAEGICVRLYSEQDFISRPEFTDAEIQRTNLAAVILQMLGLKLGDINQFPFVDKPDQRFVNDGFKLLEELQAVDQKRRLTTLGKRLSCLPLDPRMGRMLLAASETGCLEELLIIASALSVQDPRERPLDKQQAATEKHSQYADKDSDFISLINLWQSYEQQRQELSQNQLRKYSQRQFLSFMKMREWRDIHHQLKISCRQLGLKTTKQEADYAAIHKALLTGLLGHIGQKYENKEYLGARNKKFLLFPGSGLYKAAPKWILAGELVETSKLYGRMLAKIEPEWLESVAAHLIKRSYFEPHWQKKSAQVCAFEQLSIYGLVIIAKRPVHYGKIDVELSHEIFIRQALVEGQFVTKAKFFQHNLDLLQDIEALEDKSRRRDLLVDEEHLYQFYKEKIGQLGGSHIVNGAGFHHWLKTIELKNPQALYMQQEDLLQRPVEDLSQYYPDQLQMNGLLLKLDYNFAPKQSDDGVSTEIPLHLLHQASSSEAHWLVPGLLREKCIALLKGLPKSVRKNFVPIPDYVDKALVHMNPAEGDLYEALAKQLKRLTLVAIEPEQLRQSTLPEHLQMNFKVLDNRGQIQAESRDLKQLQIDLATEMQTQINQQAGQQQWGEEGLTRWSFTDLPERIQLEQDAGASIEAYPALEDQGNSVNLVLMNSLIQAEKASKEAVLRLALLSLAEQQRYATKNLPKLEQTLLLTGDLWDKKSLLQDCVKQALQQLLKLDQSLPRTQEDFQDRLDCARAELVDKTEEIMLFVADCAILYQRIKKKLKGQQDLHSMLVLNDIKAQLSTLFYKGFLQETYWQRLQHYPRYLTAIELRLEKFKRNLRQENLYSEQLSHYRVLYQQQLEIQKKKTLLNPNLEHFRWLLEEYRVSLFAQQLGTNEPISDKRLDKYWQTVIKT